VYLRLRRVVVNECHLFGAGIQYSGNLITRRRQRRRCNKLTTDTRAHVVKSVFHSLTPDLSISTLSCVATIKIAPRNVAHEARIAGRGTCQRRTSSIDCIAHALFIRPETDSENGVANGVYRPQTSLVRFLNVPKRQYYG
jgi:hypothetical protein